MLVTTAPGDPAPLRIDAHRLFVLPEPARWIPGFRRRRGDGLRASGYRYRGLRCGQSVQDGESGWIVPSGKVRTLSEGDERSFERGAPI